MAFRPVGRPLMRPIVAGIGAVAAFAAVGVLPGALAAADDDPSPGSTIDPSKWVTELAVSVSLSQSTASPGDHVTATVTVSAGKTSKDMPSTSTNVDVSAPGLNPSPSSKYLATVFYTGKSFTVDLTVPKSAKSGAVSIDATATGPRSPLPVSGSARLTVKGAATKPPDKPTTKPTPNPTHSSPTTTVPNTPGGTGGGGTGTVPNTGGVPGMPQVGAAPAIPSAQTVNAPEVALPPVASPQLATATPDNVATSTAKTALRSADAVLPTAQKIGPAAAGWMAALLAGQFLVLTRVRMMRRRRAMAGGRPLVRVVTVTVPAEPRRGAEPRRADDLATHATAPLTTTAVLDPEPLPEPEPEPALEPEAPRATRSSGERARHRRTRRFSLLPGEPGRR
ncbi:hypothetical protein [Actinomadura atramentaria]|uniref:hypothetical protein n=1 Tax=Actinomadura atramentaria TaxID=1990 RepID=UPI000369F176|nr:hypothetical protein [Actinomadura atramentaria]